jgi:hypothetical protein
MTTQTLDRASTMEAISELLADLAGAAAEIAAGWRATRDWSRLAHRPGTSRGQVAREVFERNFA